jgi:hypothetical protein
VLLAGKIYGAFEPFLSASVDHPLKGMTLGKRIAFLRRLV